MNIEKARHLIKFYKEDYCLGNNKIHSSLVKDMLDSIDNELI